MVDAPIPPDYYMPWFSEVRTGLNIINSSGSQIVNYVLPLSLRSVM